MAVIRTDLGFLSWITDSSEVREKTSTDAVWVAYEKRKECQGSHQEGQGQLWLLQAGACRLRTERWAGSRLTE